MHDGKRIKSCTEIVHYNAGAFRQPLQSANGKRLPDIEDTEKYKAREKRFPNERYSDERDELPSNFVDDDELRIFRAKSARDPGGGGNSDEGNDCGRDDRRPHAGGDGNS